MSSVADNRSSRRKHDADASRLALLDAATELFDERGYDGATVRDIGERAGVDPALIARYFSCKEGLYFATLEREDRPPLPAEPAQLVTMLLAHGVEHGGGPIPRAMVRPTLSDDARERIRRVMAQRITDALAAELERRGAPEAQLRAEILVAVAIGVGLTRQSGTLPTLSEASLAELVAAIRPVVAALEGPGT